MNAQRDKRLLVHATSVIPGKASTPFAAAVEAAVLLFGDSGSGKSDVALRLIAMGGQLLSDDQTELFVESGRLFAAAPEPLRNHMEIRGVGIRKAPSLQPGCRAVVREAGRKERAPVSGHRSTICHRGLPYPRHQGCFVSTVLMHRRQRRSPQRPLRSSPRRFYRVTRLSSEPDAAMLPAFFICSGLR